MNKIFKVVWSKVRNAYVVVSEIAKNTVSGVGKRNRIGKVSIESLIVAAVLAGGAIVPNIGYTDEITSVNPFEYAAIGGAVKGVKDNNGIDWTNEGNNPFIKDTNSGVDEGEYIAGVSKSGWLDNNERDSLYVIYDNGTAGDTSDDIRYEYHYISAVDEAGNPVYKKNAQGAVTNETYNYWIRAGFNVVASREVYHPDATPIKLELFATDTANYDGIIKTGEHSAEVTHVTTAINDDALYDLQYHQYTALTNTSTTNVATDHQFYVKQGKHYNDIGGSNFLKNFYVLKNTNLEDDDQRNNYNAITGKYQFNGKDIDFSNIYQIGPYIGVFLTKSVNSNVLKDDYAKLTSAEVAALGADVYGGTVYGHNNEVLVTGYNSDTNSWSTAWGAAITDPSATIETMRMSEFNEMMHHLYEQNVILAEADTIGANGIGASTSASSQIQIEGTSGVNFEEGDKGGVVNFTNRLQNDAPGFILKSSGGTDGNNDDVKISIFTPVYEPIPVMVTVQDTNPDGSLKYDNNGNPVWKENDDGELVYEPKKVGNQIVYQTNENGQIRYAPKVEDNQIVYNTEADFTLDAGSKVVANGGEGYDDTSGNPALESLTINGKEYNVMDGWKAKVTDGTTYTEIKVVDDAVIEFVAGQNIALSADNATSKITIATESEVEFSEVTVGSVVIDSQGIGAGSKQIRSVANGTADSDAVNLGQLKAATTVVAGGENVTITPNTDDATHRTTYTVSVDDSVFVAKNNLKVENVVGGNKLGVWKITDSANGYAVYTNTVLNNANSHSVDDYGYTYTITDTAGNSVELDDVAKASKLRLVADAVEAIETQSIKEIGISASAGGTNYDTIDLIRNDNNGTKVPGSLKFTSGGGEWDGNAAVGKDTYILISQEGNVNEIKLNTGSIVEAVGNGAVINSNRELLDTLTINGKSYFIPQFEVSNTTGKARDYRVASGIEDLGVNLFGYKVDDVTGIISMAVVDKNDSSSVEHYVNIGNIASKTKLDELTTLVGDGNDLDGSELSNNSSNTVVNHINNLYTKVENAQNAANVKTEVVGGSNITVTSTNSNEYTVALDNDITLSNGTGQVAISGTNSTVTVGAVSTKQVVVDGENGTLSVGSGFDVDGTTGKVTAGTININGETNLGTITGLSNTSWAGTTDDSSRAATEGQLKDLEDRIGTSVNTKIDGVVKYDVNNNVVDKTKITLEGSGGTTITNVKNGSVSANSTDAINGSQLYDVEQKVDSNTSRIGANETNITNLQQEVAKGWTAKVNGTDVQNIKMGGSQNFVDGTNIKLTAGENNSIKVSTATDVKFEKVTVGDVVMDSDGINAGNKKITNVAAGTEDNDAVNVKQLKEVNANASAHANFNTQHIENLYGQDQYLDSRINQVNSRVNKVGAGAAALAALHPMDFDPDDKLSFAVGAGNYAGETATALGAFYRPNEKVMMNVGGTYGNGENMVNVGMSFALDRTNNVSNSRTAMAKEIVDLREQVATQGQQIAQLVALVQQLTGATQPIVPAEQLFPDVPQNHWAYEYVNGLIAKGIIEGYPDGTFGGDRTMTRYEFAAMLFRAMEQGVVINEQVRQEFEKELGRIRVDRVKGTDNDPNKIERVRVNSAIDRDDYGSKVVQVKH